MCPLRVGSQIGSYLAGCSGNYTLPDNRMVFSYKLRYIIGFGLVGIAISTNPKPTIYRNLYVNTAHVLLGILVILVQQNGERCVHFIIQA